MNLPRSSSPRVSAANDFPAPSAASFTKIAENCFHLPTEYAFSAALGSALFATAALYASFVAPFVHSTK